jgi:hypothetical protein
MNKRFVLVVGDKFVPFTTGKDAITLSHLSSLLNEPSNLLPAHSQIVLVPGQGLSDSDVENVLKHSVSSLSHRFNFDLWYNIPKRASSLQSHKHKPENTLISEPTQISEDVYELQLLIDDDCELMRDHQSGHHIQGMVLVEAARQSLLAVTEKFFIKDAQQNYSFVFNSIDVEYSNFAFPIAAKLHYEILEKDVRSEKRLAFSSKIRIDQCGAPSAVCGMSFTAFDAQRITKRESLVASKTFDHYIEAVSNQIAEEEVLYQANIA